MLREIEVYIHLAMREGVGDFFSVDLARDVGGKKKSLRETRERKELRRVKTRKEEGARKGRRGFETKKSLRLFC